jgi:hypothetical protein
VANIAPVPLLLNYHPELAVSNLVNSLHFWLGYGEGWGMAMEYLINPLICTAFCAPAAKGGSETA